MSDGQMAVEGRTDVGTHYAFVRIVARLSWALKDVSCYQLAVVSIPVGVRISLHTVVPSAEAGPLTDSVRALGFTCHSVRTP